MASSERQGTGLGRLQIAGIALACAVLLALAGLALVLDGLGPALAAAPLMGLAAVLGPIAWGWLRGGRR